MENTNEKKDNIIVLPTSVEQDKVTEAKGFEYSEDHIASAEKFEFHIVSIYESLTSIIKYCKDSTSDDTDIDNLQMICSTVNDFDLKNCINITTKVDGRNITKNVPYYTIGDIKLINIYTDILMQIGYAFNLYKIISKRYAKKPIFTQQQIAAAGGNPEMIWKLQAQQDMQALQAQMGVLDKLISLLLFFIGINDVKDPMRQEIIDHYKFAEPADNPVVLLESINEMVEDILDLIN